MRAGPQDERPRSTRSVKVGASCDAVRQDRRAQRQSQQSRQATARNSLCCRSHPQGKAASSSRLPSIPTIVPGLLTATTSLGRSGLLPAGPHGDNIPLIGASSRRPPTPTTHDVGPRLTQGSAPRDRLRRLCEIDDAWARSSTPNRPCLPRADRGVPQVEAIAGPLKFRCDSAVHLAGDSRFTIAGIAFWADNGQRTCPSLSSRCGIALFGSPSLALIGPARCRGRHVGGAGALPARHFY